MQKHLQGPRLGFKGNKGMSKNRKLLIAKLSLILGVVPLVIHAYEFGPDPRRTGAPGDAGTCLGSGCHTGTLNGPGNVQIVLPNGNTYTPGVKQHIQVQITDSTRQKFGFQLTARLASNLTGGQAGDFTTTDTRTQVLCDDGSTKANGSACSASFPVQFIEHTLAGYTASTAGAFTYEFDWTPPATNAGNVTLYVAANAGPGGAPVQNNADIYLANVTLTPAAAGSGPTPDPGGIVPIYSSSTTISPGTWVSVYSTIAKNLASGTSIWNGDFPTTLGGVTVKINNKPAYLWFVSPTQFNLQAPDDTATGSVPVTITNGSGSFTTTVNMGQTSPSFLLLADAKHATGIIITPDGSGKQGNGTYDLLGPVGAPGSARPARVGEPVAIYGVGFGPTSPAVPAGQIFNSAASMITKPVVTVGGAQVTVDFAGLVGAGLYQINFVVPGNAGSGDRALLLTSGGLSTQNGVFVPIQ